MLILFCTIFLIFAALIRSKLKVNVRLFVVSHTYAYQKGIYSPGVACPIFEGYEPSWGMAAARFID